MMKSLAALAVLSTGAVASAGLIVQDAFDYTAGDTLRNSGPWVGSNSNTPRPTIASGSLTYPGLPPSAGNSVQLTNANGTADRVPTGAVTGGTLYYSFILQPTAADGTVGSGGAFFAGFDDHSSGTAFTTAAALFIRTDADDTSLFDLGIATNGSANKGWTGGYAPNDPLFVVGSFTFGGAATLDVFAGGAPVPGAEPVTHTATSTGVDSATSQVLSFYLRQNTGEPSSILVDELRIGTAWADVIPVPEPATIGLIGSALLALTARRRAAHPCASRAR